jgi:hypothetical protein
VLLSAHQLYLQQCQQHEGKNNTFAALAQDHTAMQPEQHAPNNIAAQQQQQHQSIRSQVPVQAAAKQQESHSDETHRACSKQYSSTTAIASHPSSSTRDPD